MGSASDSLDGLQVSTAADSADLIRSAFGGASDEASHKARAIIALNAGREFTVPGARAVLPQGLIRRVRRFARGRRRKSCQTLCALPKILHQTLERDPTHEH